MAEQDASEIVIAGNATIWVAPEGTTLPVTEDDTLDDAFVQVGFTTRDGVKFTDSKQVGTVEAHQSFYPVRRFIESRDATAEFTMEQWNQDTISLAFGGGTWDEPETGHFVYTPPSPETVDERAMVIDLADGLVVIRLVIPNGMVVSNSESTFVRTGAALLPITFGVLGTSGAQPWSLATNAEVLTS